MDSFFIIKLFDKSVMSLKFKNANQQISEFFVPCTAYALFCCVNILCVMLLVLP